MPVYDAEKYLEDALESVIAQTFCDFELIIIDDSSKDRTGSIIARYQQKDNRIHTYRQERRGLIDSLNKGCDLARGRYIARMDADDVSLPHRLEEQVKFMEGHPDIGVLGCGVQLINSQGERSLILKLPTEHGFLKWGLCFYCPIAHPTVMMRKDAVKFVGGYSKNMLHAEDYDLWRRLSSVTHLSNLPDVLLYLRKHDDNVSSVHVAEQRAASIRVSQLMISEILGENIDIDLVRRLWNKDNITSENALKIAELIYKLCTIFIADNVLSISEKESIRKDAVHRLLMLRRSGMPDIKTIKIVHLACQLDPLNVACRALKAALPHRVWEYDNI